MSGSLSPSERWNELLRESDRMDDIISNLSSPDSRPAFIVPGSSSLIVLRPLFMSTDQVAVQRAASESLLSAHRKVLNAVLEDDTLRKRHFSGFFEWTDKVLGLDRPGPVHATCLRLDGSLVNGKPVFFELNADMPGGISHTDSCAEFLAGLPIMERFEAENPVEPLLLRESFLQALLAEWEYRGGNDSPRICFVTWKDEPVSWSDMSLNRDYFSSRGYHATVCDPRDLDFNGENLFADGRRIDVVYRVISTAQTLEKPYELEPLIKAERADAVLMVNSFYSELMGNKTMFALLQDEGLWSLLTPGEVETVTHCTPWTRVMRDGHCTEYAGKRVEMVEWVLEHREELVLKPSHDFGGHGVTIGSESTDLDWERALNTALENDFIVQRKIRLERGLYPVAEKGLPSVELYEDVDPLLLRSRFSGCITRLSQDEITNIHRHGAMGALFELVRTR